MFYCRILILLLLIKFRVKCEDDPEERASVKFLLSDAKEPDFNLEEFQQKKIIEEDNVAAESIILPTLNLESHPYAVVVLPDLNKYASKTFKRGRLTLDDIISGSIGIMKEEEDEERQQNSSSSYEPSDSEYNGLFLPDIPVIPVIKSEGEIIDLSQNLNSYFPVLPIEESDGEISDLNEDLDSQITVIPIEDAEEEIIDLGQNSNPQITVIPVEESDEGITNVSQDIDLADEDENSQNYDYELINNDQPVKDVEVEMPTKVMKDKTPNFIRAKNVATIRELKDNLAKYLSSGTTTDQDTDGEILSAETNQHSGKTSNSNEKYKISSASLEKKSRVTFKGFPLRFNNVVTSPPIIQDQKIDEKLPSKTIDSRKRKDPLPNTILKVQSIQTLPIVNEFSSLKKSVPSSNKSEQQNPNSVTKNQFLTLGKARELRPVPVQENSLQDKIMDSKTDSTLSGTFDDKIEHTKQDKKSTGSNVSDYVELILKEPKINSEKKITENLPTKPKQNVKSNLNLESDSLSNAFEFVRAIGTPISFKEKSKGNSSNLLSGNEGDSISEQREQINQLLKLRKQLMLLDTSSFATGNFGRSSDETNPERKLGSLRVKSSKDTESGTQLISAITQDKIINNSTDDHEQISDLKSLSNKERKDFTLTWSKFLKTSEENDKTESYPSTSSPSPVTENSKFNNLESIKTPIKERPNLHTRHKSNQSEEINVVFEKFDISNVIPSITDSKQSTDSTSDLKDQISYNLPELSLDGLNSYESQTNQQEVIEQDPDSLPYFDGNSKYGETDTISSEANTPFRSLQSSLPTNSIIEDCEENSERCIHAIIKKQVGSTKPTDNEFVPRAFQPIHEIETPTAISTIYHYNQDQTLAKTVQLATVSPRLQTVAPTLLNNHPFTDELQETSQKVEPRSVSTFTDFTVTNPVHRASLGPHSITTSYLIHNVLSLDTITRYATVTVMTPSAVFHTHTEVIEQTRYVTITKTIPAEPLYTSTILHVMPDPKTVTLSVATSTETETSTIDSPSTVTHTLYSTICNDLVDDESPSDDKQYNNYGINPENLFGAPTNFHLRAAEFKDALNKRGEDFDEVFWPKTEKTNAWPDGFDPDKFIPSSEITGADVNYLPDGFDLDKFTPSSEITGTDVNYLPDSEAQESSLIMTVAKPSGGSYNHRNRQRMSRSNEYEDNPLIYGVPFYGFKPINNDYPTYRSPGRGNSMKIKV